MCYSAQIKADYLGFLRRFGATLSLSDFVRLYWERDADAKVKLPKGTDALFADDASEEAAEIRRLIGKFNARQTERLEQELFKQRRRLADAERALQAKTTKSATESRRIAGSKIDWCLGKLAERRRSEPIEEDWRIFPAWHAPVMVVENGRRVIKPMRYQCRLAGKPAFYDAKFPGTYNARRDSLGGYWKPLFGRSHGLMVANAFFENVARKRDDGSTENVVLEFRPQHRQDMLVACLWSRWVGANGEELLSFAAITDEPPAEVAAAGHDRCIVPIRPENVDAWLSPDPRHLDAQQAILDDRERPYYEHTLAA
jgi:putative SOS response-associated peptidase YedK